MSSTMPNSAATRPAMRRDTDRQLLLGVCAGLARVLEADPAIVRAAWIVAGLFTGPLALIAYVATAVVVPRDDGRTLLFGTPPDRRENVIGVAGVALASTLLLASAPAFDVFWIDRPFSSPLLIVALVGGAIVLARANRERAREDLAPAAAAAPDASSAEAATAVVDADPPQADDAGGDVVPYRVMGTRAPSVADDALLGPEHPGFGGTGGSGGSGGSPPTIEQDAPGWTPPGPPTPPAPAPPRGPSVFLRFAGAVVAGAAVAVVLDASGAVDLRASTVAVLLGVGALAAGVTAAVAAGRRGTGVTLALGIVLAVAAAGVAAIGPQLDDGVGYRAYRPTTAADIQPQYRLGLGFLELDLRDVALAPGSVTTVKADVGAGHIELRVPDDVRVQPVGDTSIDGTLAPIVAPRRGDATAPIVRIDANTDVGGPLDVVRHD
jgi:phage shock protein PspC (stress-responsive transcriptional regulator)